jgi:hypothetical protein
MAVNYHCKKFYNIGHWKDETAGKRFGDILSDIYSFGNPASCGNAAMNKEHKLLLHTPFFHSDHLVIKVQITVWAPTTFNIH